MHNWWIFVYLLNLHKNEGKEPVYVDENDDSKSEKEEEDKGKLNSHTQNKCNCKVDKGHYTNDLQTQVYFKLKIKYQDNNWCYDLEKLLSLQKRRS